VGLVFAVLSASIGCDVKKWALNPIELQKFDKSESFTKEIPYSGERIFIDNDIGIISIKGMQDVGFVPVRPFIIVEAVKKVRGLDLSNLAIAFEEIPGKREIRIQTMSSNRGHNINLKGGLPPKLEDKVAWVEYTIRVPQNAALSLHQDAGYIDISGFKGDVMASVEFGGIKVENSILNKLTLDIDLGDLYVNKATVQELAMTTKFGDIRVEEVRDFVSAKLSSSAGTVFVKNSAGQSLTVSNQGAGAAEIVRSQFEAARLSTQAGSISFSQSSVREGQLSTQWGGITFEVSRAESLQLAAKTQFGGIKLRGQDRTVKTNWSGFWPGKQVILTVGGGQDQMTLNTQVGSIRITFVDKK
jgi:hypothetical protein